MPDPTIGAGFNQDIGYRYKPGQTQAEFYSQKTGQTFGDANALAGYVNQNYQGANATSDNVFGVLAGGFTPRADALNQIKDQLNQFQQNTFNQSTDPAKRASSTLQDNINSQQAELDKYLSEYNDLRTKPSSITAPNYQQAYLDLANAKGIPALNAQVASLDAQRNNLPYLNRAASGNAGIETESQLASDTSQKDVPLYIQQQNAIDRLKLAQDFINNSLNLKQLDYNASRQAITDAASLLGNTLDFTRTHLTDLMQRQQQEQQLAQAAQDFAIQNGIDQPYYQVGNTIYSTATREPVYVNKGGTISTADGSKAFSSPEQFFSHSGLTSFDQIYHMNSTTMADKQAVLDLRQRYPDAGISSTDSFDSASAKLSNSRIYREQVRPPASGGGGGLSPYQTITGINAIQDNAKQDPDVSQFTGIRGAYEQARQAVQQGNSAGDIVLMRTLAKITDPTTGVREEEYKTFQNAVGTLPRFGVQLTSQMVGKGQLTTAGRKALYQQVENIYNQREAAYMNKINFYQAEAQAIGGSIPFYTAPKLEAIKFDQPQQNQNQTGGFWSKVGNWLFGG